MPRKKRRRPNWPYRWSWVALLSAIALYIGGRTLVGGFSFAKRSFGIDWSLAFVSAFLDATMATCFVAVGSAIGSFLNVVAYRLPLGRNIGGHSGCPYCQTPIESRDNIPVLGWVKLRGRCRTCRLPISSQYPLVELLVAGVFLFVYLTEVRTNAFNLPFSKFDIAPHGVLWLRGRSVDWLRILSFLFAICGLIAAAIIALKRQGIPTKLFVIAVTPWTFAALFYPAVIIVPWRAVQFQDAVTIRLDALVSLLCGAAAAVAFVRAILPLLYPGFDRKLISSDAKTIHARQTLMAFAICGMLVGWQSVPQLTVITLIVGIAGSALLRRWRSQVCLANLTVWMWLGLMLLRGSWKPIYDWTVTPDTLPLVIKFLLSLAIIAPLAWLFARINHTEDFPTQPTSTAIDESAYSEVDDDDDDWDDEAEERPPHPSPTG